MYLKHDKEKVLKIGMELFRCKGYHNLGINEICKVTGMTKGAFYNAFKSKENFLLDCIETYGLMNVNFLTEELSNTKEKAIHRILNMYVGMFEEQSQKNFIGCMTNNIMSEIGSINDIISQATAKSFRSLLAVIEPVIQEAQKDGDISNSINSASITELIHTTFFGALTRAKSTKDSQMGINTMTLLIKSLKSI